MSHPFLSLAIGGLSGVKARREAEAKAADAKAKDDRQQRLDYLATLVQLGALGKDPSFQFTTADEAPPDGAAPSAAAAPGGTPYLDTARTVAAGPRRPGPDLESPEPGYTFRPAPLTPPALPPALPAADAGDVEPDFGPGEYMAWLAEQRQLHGPDLQPTDAQFVADMQGLAGGAAKPAAPAVPGVAPGAAAAPMPATPAAGPRTPFIDLGRLTVGDRELGVRYDPTARERGEERTRRERDSARRQAFEALNQADAEAYPVFIPEFDYVAELGDYASGVRTRRVADRRASATAEADRVQARRLLVNNAKARAFDLFKAGNDLATVQAALAGDPTYRGVLSPAEVRDVEREIAAVDAERWQDEYVDGGVVKGPTGGIQVLESTKAALLAGASPQQIVDAMRQMGAPAADVKTVREWFAFRYRPK